MFKAGDWVIAKEGIKYGLTVRSAGPLQVMKMNRPILSGHDIVARHPRGDFYVHSRDFELAEFTKLDIYKALTEIE